MDVDLLFPSKYIKAADLQGKDVTLTIENVVGDELEGDKGKQYKGIVSFVGKKKKLVLNRTNALCIKAMFGRETEEWKGHKITLYPTTFNDEPCIRVKGSPELSAVLEFELKLPRKKPKLTKLLPTGKNGPVVSEFDDGAGEKEISQ